MAKEQDPSNAPGKEKEKNPWSASICLPQTEFPMKADLSKREPAILKFWSDKNVYENLLKKRKDEQANHVILHDGPPYANGNFHVGHALNKILKDIIVKYNLMTGKYSPYIPGWDCHGLPIELAVLKKLSNKKDGSDKDPIKIRKACRQYAADFIKIQAKEQTRFGVFWNSETVEQVGQEQTAGVSERNFYYTMSPEYEAAILRVFKDIFEKGLIYKGKRPIYWDAVTATAHAEAEIEYQEHTSPSVYVKFPVVNRNSLYVAIWTTTPWTLPANLALSFNEQFTYAVYNTNQGNLLIAEGLEEAFFHATDLQWTNKEIISTKEIQELKVLHPFLDRQSIICFGDHVTLEAGTGVVHTAPGHGADDYAMGLKYNLPPYSPVDHRGRYTSEFPEMQGMHVFEANEKIIELLQEKSLLIARKDIIHQYPHSWRSHAPLIMRATEQWFLKIEPLREIALSETSKVTWVPPWGENRFASTISARPDWCLSRQRYWGVPIPAFRCESCGTSHLNTAILEHIIDLVEKNGIEVWYESDIGKLLPKGSACTACSSTEFTRENDILDVWFDSGVSWAAVLKQYPELSYPAELYLEGSDQHRGWFQSSLWPSLALEGKAPYRKVLTHGYVLDDKGRAMSKSLGNVISPQTDVIDKYGADILRLWVSSADYTTDNRIGKEAIAQLSDAYRKIRNTFRYMLGNLNDNKNTTELTNSDLINDIDFWVLHELSELSDKVKESYENYEFHQIYQRILNFCTVTLSNTYFDIIRDSLYCDSNPQKPEMGTSYEKRRRSSLRALQIILESLTIQIAPILSFTAEETLSLSHVGESVFAQSWPNLTAYKNPELQKKFIGIWELKEQVNMQLEALRKSGGLGASIEAYVELPNVPSEFTSEELARILVVSEIKPASIKEVSVKKSQNEKCPRCWLMRPLTAQGLCERCTNVAGG